MDHARMHHQGTKAKRLASRFQPQRWPLLTGRTHLALVLLVVIASLVLSPLSSNLALAQDEVPAEVPVTETVPAESAPAEEPAPAPPVIEEPAAAPAIQEPAPEVQPTTAPPPPAPGSLAVRLTGSTGATLSGRFAVYDAAGTYHERWTDNGVAWFADLVAGQATVYQIDGTTDFAFNSSAPDLVKVPAGGQATLPVTNAFLDADGDGVGDSVDICAAGDDAVDTDADGTPDACDETPNGDDLTIGTPTVEPAPEEVSEIAAIVAEEPVVVEEAPVSCQQADAVSPWITTDLDDYPPGGLVTLTGGNWVAGQVIEILVEDDGLADAERGPWSHAATVTADEQGTFSYQFNIAPWFVADYSVVATGECSEAATTFTDSVTGGSCVQVTTSDVVAVGQYVMFRCPSATNPIRIGVTSISAGWEWSFVFSNSTTLAPPAYSSLSWNTSGTASDSPASGSNDQAYFFLSPLAQTLPAATGTVTVQIKNPSGNTVNYTSVLAAKRTVATSNFALSCTPTSFTASVPGNQVVSCSLGATSIAAGAIVNASIPAITPPTGWTVTSPTPATGSVSQGAPFVFSFILTSSCAASTTAQAVSVQSNLTNGTQTLTGPSTSVSIARATGTTVSPAITSSSLTWNRPYSFTAYPVNSGSLTYSVQATGCAGWNVTIAASPFVRSGSSTTIPASNLTLTSSSSPAGTGISRPVTSGPLDISTKVLNATAGNGIGTYTQTLNLNLNIPGDTLVGNYTSTLTISAASGP